MTRHDQRMKCCTCRPLLILPLSVPWLVSLLICDHCENVAVSLVVSIPCVVSLCRAHTFFRLLLFALYPSPQKLQ